MGSSNLTLVEMNVYPVKGIAGHRPQQIRAEYSGLALDRHWLATDLDGMALTQRDTPGLARIRALPTSRGLQLTAPGNPGLMLAYDMPAGESLDVQVWDDRIRAPRESADTEAWFSTVLGRDCRVVRMAGEARRITAVEHWPEAQPFGFADGYPYLLMSQASLDELSARVGFRLERERFRANLWINGETPWAEDHWGRIRIGECVFQRVKPCARCKVTTLDPRTLEPGPEPLRALAGYRRGADGGVLAGQNLICLVPGELRIGDSVIPEA